MNKVLTYYLAQENFSQMTSTTNISVDISIKSISNKWVSVPYQGTTASREKKDSTTKADENGRERVF